MAANRKGPSRLALRSEFFLRTSKLHPGYDFGSTGTLEEQAEFGRDIMEYFQESAHGGWEGFRGSVVGMSQIFHLIADIELFIQSKEQIALELDNPQLDLFYQQQN